MRADRWIIDWFGRVLPFVNWAFLLAGIAGAVGTAVGVLPPFSGSWWARLTTILLWLLFAREGYEPLAEEKTGAADPRVIEVKLAAEEIEKATARVKERYRRPMQKRGLSA